MGKDHDGDGEGEAKDKGVIDEEVAEAEDEIDVE